MQLNPNSQFQEAIHATVPQKPHQAASFNMGSIVNPPTWDTDNVPSCDIPKAEYPSASTAPISTEAAEIKATVTEFLSDLNAILSSKNYTQLSKLMNTETSFWRDHLGFTDRKFTTISSRAEVVSFIQNYGCLIESVALEREPIITGVDLAATVKCIQCFVTFKSRIGTGRGLLKLIQDVHDSDRWKIYTIYTQLWELDGFSEKDITGNNRPLFAMPEGLPHQKNWKDYVEDKQSFANEEPAVLIVGAGHSGLMTAARLGMLGVKTLIIDKQERAGDSWRKRYHHLSLHDPCWMNTMPYLPYPLNWPVYLPKDKMADFLEYYVSALELNLWTKTSLIESTWNEDKKNWTVVLESSRNGELIRTTCHPRHLVQATGLNGPPRVPTVPGTHLFKGNIIHSSSFLGATPNHAGKKVIVVGSGNSAHDIAYDAFQHGAKVTMVQRSTSYVVSLTSVLMIMKSRYNQHTPTEDSDIMTIAAPVSVARNIGSEIGLTMYNRDLPTLLALQKAGFSIITPPDLPSLLLLTQTRAGGFYIDIGCSSVIASGGISIHQGREISHVTESKMVFEDGSEVEADEIIFATGYANGRIRTREVFGEEVAGAIEIIWGLDEEGEQRGVWKRSGHPGFWVAAGSFWLSRHFSRLLALQIKAIEEGISEL